MVRPWATARKRLGAGADCRFASKIQSTDRLKFEFQHITTRTKGTNCEKPPKLSVPSVIFIPGRETTGPLQEHSISCLRLRTTDAASCSMDGGSGWCRGRFPTPA